jgi:hypothetical protein
VPPRRRSLAGAVILIVIGVLFLLGNMHVISWTGLGLWYSRYWPLLLILWGVIKLAEYMLARSRGYQASGIGVGGAMLVFFIIGTGLMATTMSQWKIHDWLAKWNPNDSLPPIFGNKYEYDSNVDQEVAAHGAFHLDLQRGSITVLPSSDNKVHISVHKTIVAYSKEDADRVDKATQPDIKTDQIPAVPAVPNTSGLSPAERERIQGEIARANAEVNRARAEVEKARSEAEKARAEAERASEEIVRVNIQPPSEGFAVTDVEVHVPPALPLDLTTGRGDIEIHARQGDVKISSGHGDVSLEDITGNAGITMRAGDLTIHKLTGNVTVDGHVSDTSITDVTGLVVLNGDYLGEMSLQNIGQAVHVTTSRSELTTGKIQGELRMDSHDLNASNVTGGFKVETRSKDIHLEDVMGDIEVSNKHGDVEIHASQGPAGNIQVTNSSGGIELALPAQGAFQVEANARNGDISSEFEEIKPQKMSEANTVASGSVGRGGKKIILSTEHADIEITKAEPKTPEKENKKPGGSAKKSDDSEE